MRQSEQFQAKARQIGITLIIAFGLAFLYMVYQSTQFDDLTDSRSLDIAQVARNMSRGEGFTTKIIRPISLTVSKKIQRHPELTLAPLQPTVMAGFFKVFGANARVAAWTSGFFFLLTLVMTYLLALRVFDPRVALLAMIMVGTDVAMLQTAISGQEGTLLAFLLTTLLFLLVLHSQSEKRQPLLAGLAGITVALLYLTEYVWIVVAIPVAIVVFLNSRSNRGVANIAVFAVLCIAAMMPWFVRNNNVTGSPFYTLRSLDPMASTMTYTGNTLVRRYEVSPPTFLSFCVDAPREVYMKARRSLLAMRNVVGTLGGPFVAAFFWVAIFIPLGGMGFRRIRIALYATMLLLVGVLAFYGAAVRLLMPLAPVMTVIGVALFVELLDRRISSLDERAIAKWRSVGVGIFVALQVLPLLLVMFEGVPTYYQQGVALQKAANELNSQIQSDGPVITDVPWTVAWYADRPAIWLPHRPVDVRRIEQEVGRIETLMLTPALMRTADAESARDWANAWRRALEDDIQYDSWVVDARLANAAWILFRHTN